MSAVSARWLPIILADKTIVDEIEFPDVGVTLRNSEHYWVRDEDGRVFEACWTDHRGGYWWDFVGESPVEPVEFMPHPLDERWRAIIAAAGGTA